MFEMVKSLFRPTHPAQTSDVRTSLFEPMEARRFLSGSGGEPPTEPDPGTTEPVITEPVEPEEPGTDPAEPGEDERLADVESPLDDLATALTALLDSWKSDYSPPGTEGFADVIQAVRTLYNEENAAVEEANGNFLDAINQVVDALDDKLGEIGGAAGDIQEVRDILDSIDPVAEGQTMQDIREAAGALGAAADELSAALDKLGADDLALANDVLAVLEPFTHAGENLDAAESARQLAEILRAGNALNPIPGVSDMLDFYAGAIDAIADKMEVILDANAWANLDYYAPGSVPPDKMGGTANANSPFGHLWAEGILNDEDNEPYIPDDHPEDWPVDQVPPGAYPVR